MQLTTQVVARNTEPRVVVLSSDPKGSEYVEWAGANDPTGNDIQIVPESVAQSVAFIKLINRGVIIIENPDDNPDLNAAIERQNAAFRARVNNESQAIAATIETPQNNDMVVLPCIGPDSRGQGQCGADVMTREKTKNDKPPLCPVHAPLAPQYIPSEEQQGTVNVKKWTRVTMGSPERQNQ